MKSTITVSLLTLMMMLSLPKLMLAQDQGPTHLRISGQPGPPMDLAMEDLVAKGLREVVVKNQNGDQVIYQGVDLWELLNRTGMPMEGALRGENLSKYILIHARDGYKVVFALPEIDPSFTDQSVLLAFLINGDPLRPGVGPLRLVVAHEKKQARWVREVIEIEIKDARE
ncbi:molybdopterin-dependent oxidoreductase [Cyclobacterium jeungdonense]|uniref:Molybdopterin-dependent oxidoreductase n=1 Tax=Cyclobacterium jeungdonense TaxID=708087 RepID=A0ABT8C4F8_9BACT|nr:molybdopterin-dependent oxidoreductase [Cyclobacterium jeungdonense]MDN3687649.1 molybdopterin-dependent oxidoreductase [Cyclobacterium jeungdonense]